MKTLNTGPSAVATLILGISGVISACGGAPSDSSVAPHGDDTNIGEVKFAALNRFNFQDYDGDGKADLVIFRPSEGKWYVHPSAGGNDLVVPFGKSTDRLVPGRYDGDLKTDIALFRPTDGTWYVHPTAGGGDIATPFGQASDTAVRGDFDGDSKLDRAIFRPSNKTWYVHGSSGGNDIVTQFGESTDRPVPADYDGDGKTDIAVFRPRNGTWYVHRSSGGNDIVTQFGRSTDRPVPDDYDGDGIADIAVFRPETGTWFIHYAIGGNDSVTQFGESTDRVVPGDYDGDAKSDIAVFRPSTGKWFIHRSSGGDLVVTFGVAGDEIPGGVGELWQALSGNTTCFEGTPVQGQCRPVVTKVFDCGELNTGDVKGWAKLGISNTGDWSFKGHAFTGNDWFAWNYVWGISLAAKNAAGKQFGTSHSGVVHGNFDPGPNNSDFEDHGHDNDVPNFWDKLAAPSPNKNSTEGVPSNHFMCNLHASTDALSVATDIFFALSIAPAVGAVVLLAGGGSGQGCWNSQLGQYEDPCGGPTPPASEQF